MDKPQELKPLAGIKVLELARILAGPWCGQLLADLGAEVIKIERKGDGKFGGDDTRTWGPPWIGEGQTRASAYYHSCNRGKSSLEIDFDDEFDLKVVHELAVQSDILIENFKVGGLKKFGLDYESLKAANPRLIYVSITGFGQTGPKAHLPGYDFIIQGLSGLMDITGEPDREPQKVGVAVVDLFTGLYTANAIQAALYRREKTDQGAYIDIALYDCGVAMLANQAMNYLASGTSPTRLGNAHPNIAPYQVFEVKDGHVIIAVGNDGQFRSLCQGLGLMNLGEEADYATNVARVENRDALTVVLSETIATKTRAEILDLCDRGGVPASPINRIEDIFADPQILHRGMKIEIEGVPGVASPIVMDGVRLTANRASPRLGQVKGS